MMRRIRKSELLESEVLESATIYNFYGLRNVITTIVWIIMIVSGLCCLFIVIPQYDTIWNDIRVGFSFPIFFSLILINVGWEKSSKIHQLIVAFHLLVTCIGGFFSPWTPVGSIIFLLGLATLGIVLQTFTSIPPLKVEVWPSIVYSKSDLELFNKSSNVKPSIFNRTSQMGTRCRHSCTCRCWGKYLSFPYMFFIGWQLFNLPMYAGLMKLPATNATNTTTLMSAEGEGGSTFGMELAPMATYMWGQRSLKIFVDPYLFLGPHSIMGTSLLSIWVSILRGWTTKETGGKYFFTILIPFCLHIIPVCKGIPNRTRNGAPINELSIALCLLGSVIGLIVSHNEKFPDVLKVSSSRGRTLINVAYGLCLIPLIGAPFASYFYVFQFIVLRARTGVWVGPKSTVGTPGNIGVDLPSPWSGRGPYAIGAPAGVAFVICFTMLVGMLTLIWWARKRGDLNFKQKYGDDDDDDDDEEKNEKNKEEKSEVRSEEAGGATGVETTTVVDNSKKKARRLSSREVIEEYCAMHSNPMGQSPGAFDSTQLSEIELR